VHHEIPSLQQRTQFKKLNQNPSRVTKCLPNPHSVTHYPCIKLPCFYTLVHWSEAHSNIFTEKIYPLSNLISSAIESLMPCYYLVNCWNCMFLFHLELGTSEPRPAKLTANFVCVVHVHAWVSLEAFQLPGPFKPTNFVIFRYKMEIFHDVVTVLSLNAYKIMRTIFLWWSWNCL
jgi:hypothetical protein